MLKKYINKRLTIGKTSANIASHDYQRIKYNANFEGVHNIPISMVHNKRKFWVEHRKWGGSVLLFRIAKHHEK